MFMAYDDRVVTISKSKSLILRILEPTLFAFIENIFLKKWIDFEELLCTLTCSISMLFVLNASIHITML